MKIMPKVRRAKNLSLGKKATTAHTTITTRGRSKKDASSETLHSGVSGEGQEADSSSTAASLVSGLRKLFLSHVSVHPECVSFAPQIKRYMRNQFDFYGIKAPARRLITKEFISLNREHIQQRSFLLSFVPLLWEQEERDFQQVGVDMLSQYRQDLLGSSDEEFYETVLMVKRCITLKSWWDTVDSISYPVIGYFVKQRPVLGVPLMQEWINDDNMWLRRVAILHQLGQKKKTDEQLLFSFCLERCHETEFFIRKAIGWALREYSKTNKKTVREFVEKNRESLSGLSIREALKYC